MLKTIEKIAKTLIVLALIGIFVGWNLPELASGNVTVTATVVSMISCTTPLTSSAFGDIDNMDVYTSSPTATTTVTSNGTVYMKVYDTGGGTGKPGLYCSACSGTADEKTIGSANSAYIDEATLTAGTEGYGMQATTTGPNLVISSRFNKTGNDVGGLEVGSGAQVTVASSSVAVNNEVVTTPLKAAVSITNLQGSYSDTVTFVCSSS